MLPVDYGPSPELKLVLHQPTPTPGVVGRGAGRRTLSVRAVLTHNNFAAKPTALVTCWRITSAPGPAS